MGAAAGATAAARVVRANGVAAVSCQAAAATAEVCRKARANSRRTVATIPAESPATAAGYRAVSGDASSAGPSHDMVVFEHHALQRDIRPLIDEQGAPRSQTAAAACESSSAGAALGKAVGDRQVLQRDCA